ncbi:hypothetical protein OCU04_012053 [Sclerotinia nivalis]|uniref:Amidoligase enzyme protein n=1 Tax=Sclerotinia nivalis TaxID=352851 RepID=A0A9X0AA88_9HELO|nr:hypothetical protein OCU04_012053 [Sclerotinia nivalis]
MESEQVLPPTSPIEVTFGFELELAIASVPDQYLDPTPDDPRQVYGITRPENYPNEFLPYICQPAVIGDDEVQEEWCPEWYVQLHALQKGIAKVLTENGFPAVADFEHEDPSKSENPQIDDLNLWVVSMDRTINHGSGDPDNINYYWWPIEIQSPAYTYNEENKLKVRAVLRILNKVYRTRCDLSADIHVHIGNKQKGFDTRTVRNFMAFVWTFENQIATIHPAHYMTEKAFSRPVSTHSLLAMVESVYLEKVVEEGREGEVQGIKDNYVIDTIMKEVSIDNLVKMLSSPYLNANRLTKRLTYSICNLETNVEKVKKTIEFRQHKSTLDDEEVYHWITVCRSIVHFASTVDENLLKEFCKEHLHKTVDEFTIAEVLMAIGLPVQAYYYGIRVPAGKLKKDQ